MKNIFLYSMLLGFHLLSVGQSITNLEISPGYIKASDSVKIRYDYMFGSSPCHLDSSVIKYIDKKVQIEMYYYVDALFMPCPGSDSIILNNLSQGAYNVELRLYTPVAEYNDLKDTVLEVHSTGYSNKISHGEQINIFPNPAKAVITIRNLGSNSTLTLYNTLGKEVLQQVATGREETLDVSTLSKGLYFITIKTREGKVVTQKFVKE